MEKVILEIIAEKDANYIKSGIVINGKTIAMCVKTENEIRFYSEDVVSDTLKKIYFDVLNKEIKK